MPGRSAVRVAGCSPSPRVGGAGGAGQPAPEIDGPRPRATGGTEPGLQPALDPPTPDSSSNRGWSNCCSSRVDGRDGSDGAGGSRSSSAPEPNPSSPPPRRWVATSVFRCTVVRGRGEIGWLACSQCRPY